MRRLPELVLEELAPAEARIWAEEPLVALLGPVEVVQAWRRLGVLLVAVVLLEEPVVG